MIDSHAHLYFDRFDDDRAKVIERAREAGVDRVLNIGIDVPTSEQAIALAQENDGFFATVGLHPSSKIDDLDGDLARIRQLAIDHPKEVVAIGEFGLDYYWKDITPEEQAPRLERQLELAAELDLPVIYHVRDALPEFLDVLESRETQPPGVFHCFAGDVDQAKRALDLGYHISFTGNVTYPKSTGLQESAHVVPLDRLLLETDCPFMSPQGKRGKRNEPSYVKITAEFLAELHSVSLEELEGQTVANTEKLFRLP
ncbi:MAG: TatD family hydrolase [Planctomycetota bacterium]